MLPIHPTLPTHPTLTYSILATLDINPIYVICLTSKLSLGILSYSVENQANNLICINCC